MDRQLFIRYTLVGMVFTFGVGTLQPILSPYLRTLGFSDTHVSWILGLFAITVLLLSPLIGYLSDYYGRRNVILSGMGIYLTSLILYMLDGHWMILSIARVLEGIASVAIGLVAVAAVQDIVDGKTRGQYAGWCFSLRHLARLIAPVFSGIIADYYFVRAPFIMVLIVVTISAILLYFVREPNVRKIKERDLNILHHLRFFLSFRSLQGMAVLGGTMHAMHTATFIFLPLYVTGVLGLDYSHVGYAIFILGVMHLFQFYFGHLSDRFGPWLCVIIGCTISATSMIMIFFTDSYISLMFLLFIHGTGNALWNVSAWSLMSDIGEHIQAEGKIISSYVSFAKIGSVVMAFFAGMVVAYTSIQSLFIMSGGIVIIGILLALPKLKPSSDHIR